MFRSMLQKRRLQCQTRLCKLGLFHFSLIKEAKNMDANGNFEYVAQKFVNTCKKLLGHLGRVLYIGINRFWMVVIFRVPLGNNHFRLIWSINYFNRPQTRLKRLKSICVIMKRDSSSRKDYSQELPHFNQKTVGKVFY